MELESVHRWSRIRNRRGRWNKNNGGSFESVRWIIRIRSMTLGISYPRVLFNVVACQPQALIRYYSAILNTAPLKQVFFSSPPSPSLPSSVHKRIFEKESLKPVNRWVMSFKWVCAMQKWKYNYYEKGKFKKWY